MARNVAELCGLPEPRDAFVDSASPIVKQLRRWQLSSVRPSVQNYTRMLVEMGQTQAQVAMELDAIARRSAM